MTGEIIHVEFPSADFEKSSAFYQALFGWRAETDQAGGHLGVRVPGGAQSSWVRAALAYASSPVVFVAVADLAATLGAVKRLGGRVLVAKMNLPGRGTFALLADPDGNIVAVTAAAGLSGAASPDGAPTAPDSPDGDAATAKPPGAPAAEKPKVKARPKVKR